MPNKCGLQSHIPATVTLLSEQHRGGVGPEDVDEDGGEPAERELTHHEHEHAIGPIPSPEQKFLAIRETGEVVASRFGGLSDEDSLADGAKDAGVAESNEAEREEVLDADDEAAVDLLELLIGPLLVAESAAEAVLAGKAVLVEGSVDGVEGGGKGERDAEVPGAHDHGDGDARTERGLGGMADEEVAVAGDAGEGGDGDDETHALDEWDDEAEELAEVPALADGHHDGEAAGEEDHGDVAHGQAQDEQIADRAQSRLSPDRRQHRRVPRHSRREDEGEQEGEGLLDIRPSRVLPETPEVRVHVHAALVAPILHLRPAPTLTLTPLTHARHSSGLLEEILECS